MNIKIILMVVIMVNIPIFLIALSGIGHGNLLMSCCITYTFLSSIPFAYWIVKKIINKFNW